MVKLRIPSKEETPKGLSADICTSELSEKASKTDCQNSMTDNYRSIDHPRTVSLLDRCNPGE